MAGTIEDPIIEDKTHLNKVAKPGYHISQVTLTRVSKKGIVKRVTYNRQYMVVTGVHLNGRTAVAEQLRGCDDSELINKIKIMIEESKNKQGDDKDIKNDAN